MPWGARWRHRVFRGGFQRAVDDKGRVILPQEFRCQLGMKFVITRGFGGCLFVMTEDYYRINFAEKFADPNYYVPRIPTLQSSFGAFAGRMEQEAERAQELAARRKAIEAAMRHLDALTAERSLPAEVVRRLQTRLGDRLTYVALKDSEDEMKRRTSAVYDDVEQSMLAAERDAVNELYRKGRLRDEPRRRMEREFDLRHAYLSNLPMRSSSLE